MAGCFVGPKGATPRRSNINRAWASALAAAEEAGTPLPAGLHFHDLRHTANCFAADTASLQGADGSDGTLHATGRPDLSGRSA